MSKYCPKCGNELPDDAQFCNECGYSVLVDDNSPVKETPKKVQKTEETETSKKDIDELFNEVINKLHNLEGKKFLVIDNISNIENQKKTFPYQTMKKA